MARIVLFGGYAPSLINFRGALLQALARRGHQLFALAPAREAPEDMPERVEALGARYIPVSLDRTGRNPLRDWRDCGALTELFRRLAPDVVLGYTLKPVLYGSLAARKAGVPRILSLVTGLGYAFIGTSWKRRLLRTGLSLGLRRALDANELVIFQNPDDRALFVDRKLVAEAKTRRVWGSGVDLDYFSPSPLPGEPVTFLLIARLLREKGIREYAEAAGMLKKRFPSARCVLVGPPDPSPGGISLEEISSWERRGLLEYRGALEDVRPAIARASVYVLPSYREGTPRSTLEAMAMGRPVITTDVPGCRETLREGQNGYLVPRENPEALEERMAFFCEHPEKIAPMGAASRTFAEERFSVEKINRAMIRFIEGGADHHLYQNCTKTERTDRE